MAIRPANATKQVETDVPVLSHPFFAVGSSNEFIPTSITAAPGLIQSAFTISARPAAHTTMSASLTWKTRYRVFNPQRRRATGGGAGVGCC